MLGAMAALLKRIHEFVLGEVQQASRSGAAFRYPVRLLYHVARKAWDDHFQQRAAALAFFTMVNLIPVTVLFLFFIGLTPFYQDSLARVQEAFVGQVVAPEAQAVLLRLFDTLSANLDALKSGTSGIVALVTLVAIGTSLLLLVERYFNDIWRVSKPSRNLFVRISLLWTGLTLLPVLLALSFSLSASIGEVPGFLTQYVLPGALSVTVFFLLYKAVPAVHVRWRPALAAALVAGLLWEVAKVALGAYVRSIAAQSLLGKVYGSLAMVPITMGWIYYSWLIVLFGAYLAYVLEHLEELHDEARKSWLLQRGFAPFSCSAALALVAETARVFREGGEPVTVATLAVQHGLHPDQVQRWVGLLVAEKVLVQTGDGSLLPGKDPSAMPAAPLAELYFDRLVQPLAVFSPSLALLNPMERRHLVEVYGGLTVRDLTRPAAAKRPEGDPP